MRELSKMKKMTNGERSEGVYGNASSILSVNEHEYFYYIILCLFIYNIFSDPVKDVILYSLVCPTKDVTFLFL